MDYWHKCWICPYFIWDEKQTIGCEGKTVIRFPDVNAVKDYINKYCANSDWKNCSIASMMNEYYERVEKNERTRILEKKKP